jgi:ABC-2 type transport system ATP-binding protein
MIQIRNLRKRFRRLEAVHDLSLDVPEGAAFGLIGANGAGKSTTLKILLNLLTADAGSATVMGVDSRRLSPAEFRQIGYVSENQRLPLGLAVEDFFPYLRPMYPAWDRQLEAALRKQFRLRAGANIGDLSHGTRLKLALASALAYRPKLLVLDEPLGGLDPLARDEVLEGLLAQAGETTVLISSHELAEIEGTLSHAAYLDAGRLRFSEPLAGLSQRFREVHVTLAPDAALPAQTPASWQSLRQSGDVVRFVETEFEERAFAERLRNAFGDVRSTLAQPMGLRSIFVTLARHSEEAQQQ